MAKSIPTYSICNLIGADRCLTDFTIFELRSFIDAHGDLLFPHRHDFYQIVLLTTGGGHHSIDFEHFDAVRGQAYAMSPGQVHGWNFDDRADGFVLNFHESFFSSALQDPHSTRQWPIFQRLMRSPVLHLEAELFEAASALFSEMLAEFRSQHPHRVEALRGLLTLLLVKFSRAEPSANSHQKGATNHQRSMMQQFEQLIEQHFHEKRLPREYAEMLFVSPNQLNAIAVATVGKSAGDLIRDRVLLEAKRLLANSDLMVSQIAGRLNFEDNSYFARFFKKSTGATPEAFRTEFLRPSGPKQV